ncbi:MAG: sigma-54-dependent transcriptional regulator [Candidatus Binatia bacterium]
MNTVLVVDDELSMALNMEQVLSQAGYAVRTCSTGAEALAALAKEPADVILLDLKLPDVSGMTLLERINVERPGSVVIMVTGFASIEAAVEAVKKGAADFLAKPFPPDELAFKVSKALDYRRLVAENASLRRQLGALPLRPIVGQSPPIRAIIETLEKLHDSDCRVLITGESGTGKELVARYLHYHGPRAERSFFAVNCSALTETLIESEFFGHEKGAFTGAIITKKGLFETAAGGTLFLDEVAETSSAFQAKLLRVIQEKEYKRVGGERIIKADVRIIASTNRDLSRMITAGTFREDLYYRLSVVNIHMPPLRERREDIPLLLDHFVRIQAINVKKPVPSIAPDALELLRSYSWPGNVRELENVVERAMIMLEGPVLRRRDFPSLEPAENRSLPQELTTLEDLERELIQRTLVDMNWNKTAVAKRLGISRRALYDKAFRLGIVLDPRDAA